MTLVSQYPDVEIPENLSFAQFVFQHFEEYGDKTAIVDGPTGRSYTFKQLKDLTRRFGSALIKKGFKQGDVFAILLPNLPEFPIIYFGVIFIGGIVTTVNPLYTDTELTHQLEDTGAKYIVTIPLFAEKAKESASKVGIKTIYVIGVAEDCEPFSELLEDDGRTFPENVEIDPKTDVACLPYSSGTQGLPKGVMLTHYNLIANVSITTHDDFVAVTDDPVILGLLPFFHSFGMVVVLSCTLYKGERVVCVPRFEPGPFLQIIQEYKVSHMFLVPPIALFLVESPLVEEYDLSSVIDAACGAAVLSAELCQALEARLPNCKCVRNGYGMTELSPSSHCCPVGKGKPGSVGILLPNLQCKVVDIENANILGPNQDGEIWVKGPTVMKGYLNNPEATAQTIDNDGWLHTGDMGHYDQDEHFYIVDRLKELIKYKGYQVSPAELESLLISHAAIMNAAVIGVPDLQAGELPMAFVVLQAGQEITAKEVVTFVEESVAPYKRLRGGVEFIDKIPKASSGKLLRRGLRTKATADKAAAARDLGENVMKSKYPDETIPTNLSWPEFIFQHFDKYGDREAIVDCVSGRSYTYSQVRDLSRRCASALCKTDFTKGDVFAIFSPNIPEFAIVYLGVLQAGGVVTGANPLYTTGELKKLLKMSNAKAIMTIPQLAPRTKEAAQDLGIEQIYVLGEADGCESVSVLFEDDGAGFPDITLNPKDDLAILPFSSGTTGLPKGVMLTHFNLVANGCIVCSESFLSFDEASVVLAFLPFYHSYGTVIILSLGLRRGSKLISVPRLEQDKFLNILQDFKVTHLPLVPPVALLLSKHPETDNFDLRSLVEITSGAAPLGEGLSQAVKDKLPRVSRMRQGYGMTELSPVCHMTPFDNSKHGSVGVLLPNLYCKVVDVETGEALGPGMDGEICVRGPTVMKGYRDNPEATVQTIDRDGWLHTGDIGRYDEDQHFYIVDRTKELIKYKGYQVPPAELESLLISHAAIEDAAVIGVPDPQAGELPMAFVVLRKDQQISEEDVQNFVAQNVAPYKKLRGGVKFIDKIPKSLSGKILRRELKEGLGEVRVDHKTQGREANNKRQSAPEGRGEGMPPNLRRSSCCVIF